MKIKRLNNVYCPLCSTITNPVGMARRKSEDENDPRDFVECQKCKYKSPIIIVNHSSDYYE